MTTRNQLRRQMLIGLTIGLVGTLLKALAEVLKS